ncbi:MAG: hypothetical protein CL926_12975 [Deltaproteobacteria bacterium]|nr:hypothetical protein [Deltaproteobacteria bacterium]
MNSQLDKNAVLLLAYLRPQHTLNALVSIKKYYPNKLYVFIDGLKPDAPRSDTMTQKKIIQAIKRVNPAKKIIICHHSGNLGCGYAMPFALDWIFEKEDQAIILEDDVVPSLSFFNFMDNCLDRFAERQDVMMVSGNKYDPMPQFGSARLTKYSFTYGWATWKNRWALYDHKISFLDEQNTNLFLYKHLLPFPIFQRDYRAAIKKLKAYKEISFWDYQWQILLWYKEGLSVQPPNNLAKNIGFDQKGTHTLAADWRGVRVAHELCHIRTPEVKEPSKFFEIIMALYKSGFPRLIHRIKKTMLESFELTKKNL